jgi:ferrous iron transport protein B
MQENYTVAIAGNPNSGKTTIFNRITGAHQHVGNYPGVTVEIKRGKVKHKGASFEFVDLPGTYNLSASSMDELVARNFLLHDKPNVVIDVVDSSTLERQLYFAIQLMELEIPTILVFNMADAARRYGFEINTGMLSKMLGVEIVETVGTTGEGIEELKDRILEVARRDIIALPRPFAYGRDIDSAIQAISGGLYKSGVQIPGMKRTWVAMKLLEDDEEVTHRLNEVYRKGNGLHSTIESARNNLTQIYSSPPELLLAEARYGIISGAYAQTVHHSAEQRKRLSDKIDRFLINPYIGIPAFLALMYATFWLTFTIGDPFMKMLESLFGWMGSEVSGVWPAGSASPLRSLLVDGIIGGVGGVIVFLPNILLLFLAISFLEDSGYMARAAFLMDRLMSRIGLHGKSFIPMLIGFGCSIPGIMGTRILENPKDRLITMLVLPLMSCGARLPIYILIIPAFFPPALHGRMLWGIYMIGILLAIGLAVLMRKTVMKSDPTPFVMELPPYRLPTMQGLFIHAGNRGWLYLRKAGTIILAISIVLWWATSYPKITNYSTDYENLMDQNRQNYIAGIMELNSAAGLPRDDESFVTALTGESDSQLENEPANELVSMINSIVDAKSSFQAYVEENNLNENSTDYIVHKMDMDGKLSSFHDTNPEYFLAADNYLNYTLPEYNAETARINSAMAEEELTASFAGRLSKSIEPLIKPIGFDWKIGTALIGAFAAKEVFVAQMGIVYSVGDADEESDTLRQKLSRKYNPLQGFCIMLFCLISAPCMATIATTRAESGSWGWALSQLFGLTIIAWILTFIVYQAGSTLGIGV